MLNDSNDAEHLLSKVKEQLSELFNAKIPILEKYQEMFQEEPAYKVKVFFEKIQEPFNILTEMFEIIKHITKLMKDDLD